MTRSQILMGLSGAISTAFCPNTPLVNRLHFNLVGAISVIKNKLQILEDRDDYYFLMNPWSNGYHHWLAEVAPKLFLFESKLREGKILMPLNRPRFISEFLNAFQFENIVNIEENAFVRRLQVVSNPNSGHFEPKHIATLRGEVLSRIHVTESRGERKLYITRKNARTRKVINEVEVTEMLSKYGFEVVDLEELSFKDQVKLLARCETIVTIHGAALTNMIFMPDEGKIWELYPKYNDSGTELNACYKRLSSVLGHSHAFIFCERQVTGRRPDFHRDNILINVKTLEAAVSNGRVEQ